MPRRVPVIPQQERRTRTKTILHILVTNLLLIASCISALLAVAVGVYLRYQHKEPYEKRLVMVVNFPAELYGRILNCLALPLLFSSLGGWYLKYNVRIVWKIARLSFIYFGVITLIGMIVAMLMTTFMQVKFDIAKSNGTDKTTHSWEEAFTNPIRNIIPENVFWPFFFADRTLREPPNIVNKTALITETDSVVFTKQTPPTEMWKVVVNTFSATNSLGLSVMFLTFGKLLSMSGYSSNVWNDIIEAIDDSVMLVARLIMWFGPVATFFFIVSSIMAMSDPSESNSKKGYLIILTLSLGTQTLLTLFLVRSAVLYQLPFAFMTKTFKLYFASLSINSEFAVLPVMILLAEDELLLPRAVTRFVCPMGTVFCNDGVVVYFIALTNYLAKIMLVKFSAEEMFAMCIISTTIPLIINDDYSMKEFMTFIPVIFLKISDSEFKFIEDLEWCIGRLRITADFYSIITTCTLVSENCKEQLRVHRIAREP